MLTEDYLIKMINLAIATLLRILGLKNSGSYQEALILIDMTFEQMLGLRASMVKSLDDDRLYYLLTRNETLDVRRLAIVANLFMEEGDIYAAQGREADSQADYIRALRYFLEVSFSQDEREAGEAQPRIAYLLEKLDIRSLGADTLWPLASYYEETAAYAQAEQTLLVMAGNDAIHAEIAPELAAFYRRMLAKSPEALAAGGMTRAQVQAGAARWQ